MKNTNILKILPIKKNCRTYMSVFDGLNLNSLSKILIQFKFNKCFFLCFNRFYKYNKNN